MRWVLLFSMISWLETVNASSATVTECRQTTIMPCEHIDTMKQQCELEASFVFSGRYNPEYVSLQLSQAETTLQANMRVSEQNAELLKNSITWKILQRQFPVH